MLGIHCSCTCFVSATFTLQVSPYQNIGFSPPQNYWIFLLKCLIFMQFLAVFGNNSNHWPIIQHKIIPIILLWSNVLSKISTTLKKREKFRNSDPYNSRDILTQKSIQCLRQQSNDSVFIKPKHCIDMKKKLQVGTLDKSKSNTPSYQSISIQSTENKKDLADRSLTFLGLIEDNGKPCLGAQIN